MPSRSQVFLLSYHSMNDDVSLWLCCRPGVSHEYHQREHPSDGWHTVRAIHQCQLGGGLQGPRHHSSHVCLRQWGEWVSLNLFHHLPLISTSLEKIMSLSSGFGELSSYSSYGASRNFYMGVKGDARGLGRVLKLCEIHRLKLFSLTCFLKVCFWWWIKKSWSLQRLWGRLAGPPWLLLG